MKVISKEYKLCLSCMEKHNISIVEIEEETSLKAVRIKFTATYEYCSNTDEYFETEEMLKANNFAVKDAYRKEVGLLTSSEIKSIREKYGISQKHFTEILDWGGATITRYENYQVQDRAHDDILRKIDSDPKWLLDMVMRAYRKTPKKAFEYYIQRIKEEYNNKKNQYLVDSICALYADFEEEFTGGISLCLNKVIEAINYFALNISNLCKVKLMKLLWYSDSLHYKRYGKSITGLAYSAYPLGALPEGHEQIILLDGIKYETITCSDDMEAYKFDPIPDFKINNLSEEEISTIDQIIDKFRYVKTDQLVITMHEENAYKETPDFNLISFSYTKHLSLE